MKTLCDTFDNFDAFEDSGFTLNAFSHNLELDNTYHEPTQVMSIQHEESCFFDFYQKDPEPRFSNPVNLSLDGNWDSELWHCESTSKLVQYDCSTEISDCVSIEEFVQDILIISPKNANLGQVQDEV